MDITILASQRSPHQMEHARAMGEGFGQIGVKSYLVSDYRQVKTKNVTTWGWRIGSELYEKGHNVLVQERGYIGDRFKYTSLGWNGLNGHAIFPTYSYDEGKRFYEHGGFLKPWKKDGDYIVILGQVKNDASLQGKDLTSWYYNTAKQLEKIHSLPVYFRPHPEAGRRGGYNHIEGISNMGGTLEECLSRAKFTVAYNSNSCLDSVLNGVPCYAGDEGTMAYDMCMGDMYAVETPSRELKAYAIAWTQWTLDEIRSGLPLKRLMKCTPQ